ncbi:glutathionyl-hydroquinone reductase [Mucilaginibacter sp. UYNi724]
MFEKLFLLVKNNADTAVMNNPVVPAEHREAVINEASSSIIEVLKNQMDTGKLKDLVKYFQFSAIYDNPLIHSVANRFANKLNNFYNIGMAEAMKIADELIPPVMHQLMEQSKGEQNKEFALSTILSKVNGNVADMGVLLNQMRIA